MKQTLISILLMLLPIMAWADDSGVCGESLTYSYVEETHTLTISGAGGMTFYTTYTNIPWNDYREEIQNIVIEEGVTSLCFGAFSQCSSLTSVVFPNSLSEITQSLFSGCTSLSSITIPNHITSIGMGAFAGCSNLSTVIIGEGVTSISLAAFQDCTNLTTLIFPNNLTNIGPYAFSGTAWLENHPDGVVYAGNIAYIFKGDMPENTNISVKDGTTNILFSFANQPNLTSLTIPNSVVSMSGNFSNCTGLTKIAIPNNVTFTDDMIFTNCNSLTSVTIPNSVTSISSRAFSGCSSLISLTIPNSVTSIGSYAFACCSSMTSVTISNNVTTLDDGTFAECNSLTSVTIPDKITSIGSDAFYKCSSLSNVKIADLEAWCNIVFNSSYSNPLYYAHHLFLNEEEIENLIIPNSITSIGNYSFYGCSSLISVTIPNSVTSIGNYSFYGCNGLISVTIPNNITSIGDGSFYGCRSLTSVTIPNSVTTIGESAFRNCVSMTTLVLPNNLTIIKKETFQDCWSLTTLDIPASVQYIYQNAFLGCTSLEEINAQPTTPPFIYNNTFSNYSVPVNVPSGCAAAYRAADNWSNFTTINDGNVYYNLNITAGTNGTVTYNETSVTGKTETFSVKEGTNATLTFTPATSYALTGLTIGGVDKLADVSDGSLTISNINSNTTVIATFSYVGDAATLTITEAGMATFCSDKDLDFSEVSGLKAYTGAGFNTSTGKLTMLEVTDVPAGTGLIVKGSAGTYVIPAKTSTSIYANLLEGVTSATELSQTSDGYTNYLLSNGASGLGFYIVSSSGGTLAAGKAYLRIPTTAASARKIVTIDFDDNTTGITDINMNDQDNDNWFDLQGRILKATPKKAGIYIRNGKKTVVK